MCAKDAISHGEQGRPPLLGVFPFSICTLGSGPWHAECPPPQHHMAQPAKCLHYSISYTKNCYSTPGLKPTCETKEMWVIKRDCIFGSPTSLIERVLALHRSIFWQCPNGLMGDLGEWGEGQAGEEMKLMMTMMKRSGE